MTTDNPDPLEVLKDAVRRQIRAYHVTRQTYDGPGKTRGRRMHSGDAPAATAILAIIAQHYAPVIAENERLREAILEVVGATRAYIPPDGIDAKECIGRILGATDNPAINSIIEEVENGVER